MMRVAYFDGVSGIAGDMTVGALLDAGAPFEGLQAALAGLGVPGFSVRVEKVKKKGVMATQFHVDIEPGTDKPHRHLKHVVEIIERGNLAEPVRAGAIATFTRLAEAEASVHGTTIEKVHFHEVGAIDAIVDIIGAHWCLHALGVEQVYAAPLNVGGGSVTCAHGVMPVPAPATARLLTGLPTYGLADAGELVTPTGAALIASTAVRVGDAPMLSVDAVGYGAGTKDLADRANVVRVQIGTPAADAAAPGTETIAVVETNLDDTTGEIIGALVETLLAAGALDAFVTPVLGKKGRPAQVLTVLAAPADGKRLAELILVHSSTFGVRWRTEQRLVLAREWREVSTPWGAVRVKLGQRDGAFLQRAPEFEDCRARAAEAGVPVRRVYEAALAAAQEIEHG